MPGCARAYLDGLTLCGRTIKSGCQKGGLFDTLSLRGHNSHVLTMKRINAKGEVVQQTSIYTRENAYLLAKEASIPMSEAAEQGVIAALRARGVEV